ncbi:hypothetical protein FRC07_014710, partial [Ceratobasidium sp. 392]
MPRKAAATSTSEAKPTTTKKPVGRPPKAKAAPTTTTTKAAPATKRPVGRPPKAAKADAAPATNGKAAPTRGRKRAAEDTETAPTKAAKKSKSDSPATLKDAADSPAPTPKAAPKPKANGALRRTASKTESVASRKRGPVARIPRVVGPTLNSVPSIPEPPRPAYQMLVFGNGDSSQFGMGPDATGEYP